MLLLYFHDYEFIFFRELFFLSGFQVYIDANFFLKNHKNVDVYTQNVYIHVDFNNHVLYIRLFILSLWVYTVRFEHDFELLYQVMYVLKAHFHIKVKHHTEWMQNLAYSDMQ